MIQMVNLDPNEMVKSPQGNFFPSKLPVSSVILSFSYLIQTPLPLALDEKRAKRVREQAEQSRGKLRHPKANTDTNLRLES